MNWYNVLIAYTSTIMNKLLIFLCISILTGCTVIPPAPPVDKHCDQIASYARGIEVLKEVGVSQADTQSYVAQPTVALFPMQRVRSLLYMKKFNTPAEAYVYMYDMCTTVGSDKMLAALDGAEKRQERVATPPVDHRSQVGKQHYAKKRIKK